MYDVCKYSKIRYIDIYFYLFLMLFVDGECRNYDSTLPPSKIEITPCLKIWTLRVPSNPDPRFDGNGRSSSFCQCAEHRSSNPPGL